MRRASVRLALAFGLVAGLATVSVTAETPAPTPFNTPLTEGDGTITTQSLLGDSKLGGGLTEGVTDGSGAYIPSLPDVGGALSTGDALEDTSIVDETATEEEEDAAVEDSSNVDEADATITEPVEEDASKAAETGAVADVPSDIILAITSFECDQEMIDVSAGDKSLVCAIAAESSIGVSTISAAFYNPPMTKRILLDFGNAQLASGDNYNGIWQVTVTVPHAEDQGEWNLGFADQGAFYGLEIADLIGNSRYYTSSEAAEIISPLQTKLTVESYLGDALAYPQANVVSSSGVTLVGMICEQADINAAEAAATVTCTGLVIPDESGIGATTAYFVGPAGKTILPITFSEYSIRQLVEATNTTEAMWSLTSTLTVPTWAEGGKYVLAESGPYQPRSVSHAGTIKLITPSKLTAQPTLRVTAATDNKAPVIGSFYCNQGREVDLSAIDPVVVSCLLRASDDSSGVSYASLHFISPSRGDSLEFGFAPQSPGLGPFPVNPQKSIAETASVELAPYAEPGAWTLARAVVADNAGNYREYKATELDQFNVQTFFLIQSPTKTFAIKPRDGSDSPAVTPGQTTSGASRQSAGMALFAAIATAFVCLVSYML